MWTRHDGRTLAAIFAHPDDESFAVGGLLAASALLGARVVVITATCGEGSRDRLNRTKSSDELATIRGNELHRACDALGAESPIQFGFRDGHLEDEGELGAMVEATLRAVTPDVIVTLGPDGAYGHRDHLALTRAVHHGFDALPHNEHRRLLHAAFPRDHFHGFRQRLQKHAPAILDDTLQLGTSRELVNWVFPLAGVRHRKVSALSAHASQVGGDPVTDFLGKDAMTPLFEEEWYIVAAGQSFPEGPIHSAFDGLP